ncbi:DNA polymerase III subunit beta [Mycoplasma zalophi]|uniref:DNA polymerase III subunit beta n=1 Tax=Mycoplasma zalophi TaxID=191287 RepID=UPI0021C9B76B|nr:DNA polymerase III subunit beta [Mycoplasma zalophi]MCU4116938.1 DNA polymerase III subunit beta [Mycoplasma zalophi]
MKFNISIQQLDKAIDRVSKALDSNPYLPALKGVLIEATDSAVTFVVSNTQIAVKHTVLTTGADIETFNKDGCEIIESGTALVPLTLFKNIVKKIDGIVKLETENSVLKIKTNEDIFEINLLDSFEYPETEFEQYGEKIVLPFSALKSIVKNVSFAAAQNATSVILNCVNISAKDNVLVAIATDGFRLARQQTAIENTVDFNFSIQSKTLKDLLNFDFKGDISMFVSENKIHINFDGSIIQTKLANLAYKDTANSIPRQFEQILTIDRKKLTELIQKASLLNSDANSKLRLSIHDSVLYVSTNRDEIGKAEVKTTEFSYNDESLDISLVTKNLTEAINVFEGEINLMFAENKQRILIVSKENKNNQQLITPQRGYW